MKNLISLFFVAFSVLTMDAKPIYTKQDSLIYEKYVVQMKAKSALPVNELVVQTALYFRETPYVASTLDNNNDEEQLVVNLHQLDCTTLVENAIALSLTLKSDDLSFSNYCKQLQTIRYRKGRIDGYSSRLHYVTDWAYDNEAKKIMVDKTTSFGGITDGKAIDFMSTHTDSYKQLKEDEEQQSRMKAVESMISKRKNYSYIKKADLKKTQNKIQNGDIIAFATSIEGLDYTHIGIAYHDKGRLSFIHASTKGMKVKIEPQSLSDYCMKSPKCTGITVLRLTETNQK